MSDHKNIYMALAAAQAVMEPVLKGAINPAFKGEGKAKGTPYADYADVVAAVRGPLTSHGVCFHHTIVRGDGFMDMRTSLVHGASDTRIDCDVPLIVAKNDMQGMKSATTYAKRVGLESVTGVAPEDDDGNAAAKAPPPEPAARPAPDPAAADVACESLANADSLDQLGAIWKDLPRHVQGDKRVIATKDAAKAKLTPARNDLGGDEIPY